MLKKLLIGASLTATVSAIASAPANAGSLTIVSIGGTAPTDYEVYDVNVKGTQLVHVASTLPNVQKALDGNAQNPTGIVELAASNDLPGFDFTKNTSLNGTIDERNIQLSSLTASDWTPTFVNTWLNQALSANGLNLKPTQVGFLANILTNYGGEQRFSNPNISYANENDTTGLISIGLAGHYNANSLLTSAIHGYLTDPTVSESNKALATNLLTLLGNKPIQASDIVKVTYNGELSRLLYSFSATPSGLVSADDNLPDTGNYEVTFQGLR